VSGVSGIDPSGCQAIVSTRTRLKKKNVQLVLVGITGEKENWSSLWWQINLSHKIKSFSDIDAVLDAGQSLPSRHLSKFEIVL
jgi:hypothetical protein